ncbi:hypothetical protein [uncultured Corynebacterium sp.]|uniref:hypothetical protein n=1 Tax=uncultured Corynebacterium sp. TaxID=159447 RepID=UPI0025DE779B|nr:hypothetical protein [uncultured Corynebacterium sp.]
MSGTDAWQKIPSRFRKTVGQNETLHGHLVSNCMFGFWVSLLDAGGGTGFPAPRHEVSHDEIWDRELLLTAFPGGRPVATTEHGAAGKLNRSWVHEQVRKVHLLRNRVAHHEPLIRGYGDTCQPWTSRSVADHA